MKWKMINNQLNKSRGMNKRETCFFGCKRVQGEMFLCNFENLMVIFFFRYAFEMYPKHQME